MGLVVIKMMLMVMLMTQAQRGATSTGTISFRTSWTCLRDWLSATKIKRCDSGAPSSLSCASGTSKASKGWTRSRRSAGTSLRTQTCRLTNFGRSVNALHPRHRRRASVGARALPPFARHQQHDQALLSLKHIHFPLDSVRATLLNSTTPLSTDACQ